jgi:paraquat-inducible protein B
VSKQVSKTAIGAFVIGAIALVVAAVVIVGSGKFFAATVPCVFYFNGSVQGLSVGSPVTFKGVEIGEVTDISLIFDSEEMQLAIPVRAVLYPDKIHLTQGKRGIDNMYRAIDAGLRARLEIQSLITGQLMIGLDFREDKPAELKGDGTVLEIPTVPTAIEQLAEVIKNIRFDEILEKLSKTADGIETLVNNPDLLAGIQNFNRAVQHIEILTRDVDQRVEPFVDSVISAVDEYGRLAKNLNTELDALSDVIELTLASAQVTAEKMEKTLSNAASITTEGSPVIHELTRSLRELSHAARALRTLAESLERHPESVIFGKGDSQ